MIQAVKDIFTPDDEHDPRLIAAFMSDWVNTDAGDRNQLIEDWRSGKLQLLKTETSSGANVTTGQDLTVEDGIQADENGRAEGGVVDSEVDTEEQSQQIQQPNLIASAYWLSSSVMVNISITSTPGRKMRLSALRWTLMTRTSRTCCWLLKT